MKQLALISVMAASLVVVTGCGVSMKPNAVGSLHYPSVAPKPPTNDPSEPLRGSEPKVVFIGDSVTYLWQTLGQAEWSQHPNWINKGIIGQNSTQIAARFQADVIDEHPDVVVILAGTNDVYSGWQLGPSEVPQVFQNAIDSPANLQAMISQAQAAGIYVVLATIPPWNCVAADNHCALAQTADPTLSRYERIATWNQYIEQVGFTADIPVINFHDALMATDGERYTPSLTIDGVHPTAAGYAVMEPLVEKALDSLPVWGGK